MRYPVFMKRFNSALAFISGILIFTIGVFAVFESICRTFFDSPTRWSLDVSMYLLIWAIMLGSAYAFQEKGHVSVELLRDLIEKIGGQLPRKVMAIVGYAMSLFVIFILFRASILMVRSAITDNQLTIATIQIPIIYLDISMVIASAVMLTTLVFIIMDIISGGEKYL